MNCLLCGHAVAEPGEAYCDRLCYEAHAEQRRVRFAEPATPPAMVALIDRWIGGQATAEEEATILAYLGRTED